MAAAAHGSQDTPRVHVGFGAVPSLRSGRSVRRAPAPPRPPAPPAPPAPGPLVEDLRDAIQTVFDRWDVDRSGHLSLAEFRQGIEEELLLRVPSSHHAAPSKTYQEPVEGPSTVMQPVMQPSPSTDGEHLRAIATALAGARKS